MLRKQPQIRVESSLSANFLRRRMARCSRRGERGKVALYSTNKMSDTGFLPHPTTKNAIR
jgi:hypothetical protein